jgi:ribosome recycling factor
MNEYFEALDEEMVSAVGAFGKELSTVRTGRASPQLLDSVRVEVASYGASMPLNQLATVTAPDARLLVVNPWNKGTLGDVERAIGAAGLGLNPSNDGNVVHVPIPALTGERREELVKQVRRYAEESRVRVRRIRREYLDLFKSLEDGGEITEDDLRRAQARVQQATDDTVGKLDGVGAEKESEVLDF